jgi:Lon protease-like protein
VTEGPAQAIDVSPMFPLGTVLFPGAFLPLHVFEPRYRALTEDCLAGDRCFGVVLIERGSEVGGGDVRVSVGTRATIADARELDDGRWLLGVIGVERVRVTEWLPEDPYPRARVDVLAEPLPSESSLTGAALVERQLRRALGLWSELGERGPPATFDLAEDRTLATYQMCALAPVGPADSQALLEAEGTDERLILLESFLDDAIALFAHRLGSG